MPVKIQSNWPKAGEIPNDAERLNSISVEMKDSGRRLLEGDQI